MKKEFEALWPGVHVYPVMRVLSHELERAPEVTEALVHEVLALPGPEAATRLMQPMIEALPHHEARDRPEVLQAIDALVRAGGDPGPILDAVVACASDWQTASSAGQVLHRFALRGGSLAAVHDALVAVASDDEDVLRAQRLARLEAQGLGLARESLARALANQPLGNLRRGIGLLEAQLLSSDQAEAELALVCLDALESAGSSMHESFLAILPVLTHQLASPDPERRAQAASAISQSRFACKEFAERSALIARLDTTLRALAKNLGGRGASVSSSAVALRVLVELGASLESVRSAVEDALGHDDEAVRSSCSKALSLWKVRMGQERALPEGCSYRATYATSTAPVSERTSTCPACRGENAVTVYAYEGPEQFYRNYIDEVYCPDCEVWSVTCFQASG